MTDRFATPRRSTEKRLHFRRSGAILLSARKYQKVTTRFATISWSTSQRLHFGWSGAILPGAQKCRRVTVQFAPLRCPGTEAVCTSVSGAISLSAQRYPESGPSALQPQGGPAPLPVALRVGQGRLQSHVFGSTPVGQVCLRKFPSRSRPCSRPAPVRLRWGCRCRDDNRSTMPGKRWAMTDLIAFR